MRKTLKQEAEEWAQDHWDDASYHGIDGFDRKFTQELSRSAGVIGYMRGYQAAQPRWISVKERLPRSLEAVIVLYAPTNQSNNDHRMECWNWPEDEVYEKRFLTHWMPAPIPPVPEGE